MIGKLIGDIMRHYIPLHLRFCHSQNIIPTIHFPRMWLLWLPSLDCQKKEGVAISRSNDATFKGQLGSVLAGAGRESNRATRGGEVKVGGVNVSCVWNVRGMGKNEVTITAQS